MLQRIAPKFTPGVQAIAVPLDDEEAVPTVTSGTNKPTSLYTLAVLARVGLVAIILARALTLWQW